jgi:adenine-specific DNA methylase
VRSLIEQWFPAATVGAESLRDGSAAKKPPPNRLHVWWARRPLTISRAAVVASLLPAWPTDEEVAQDPRAAKARAALEDEFGTQDVYHDWFVKTLGILGDPVLGRKKIAKARETGVKLADGGYGYKRAFTVTPESEVIALLHRLAALRADTDDPPVVLDPFAGGGSIPLEAARYGCRAIANELNPVAVAILHGTVRLPGELGKGFAETLRSWGTRWAKRVERRLAPYFPKAPDDETIVGYIWAHTVPCPTTGLPTPLAPDFWLARGKAGRNIAVRLDADPDTGTVERSIVAGNEAAEYGNRATYKGGSAVSIWSAETTFDGDYIRGQAQAGNLGAMLLAVSVTRPGVRGRQFRAPTTEDLEAVKAAEAELEARLPEWEVAGLVPNEEIPYGTDTRPQQHGLYRWRDLFTPRQLLTNITALEELHRIVGEAEAELGAEQAKALALYLAFMLDKCVDYNGRLASWQSSRTKVRNTFDRHDFSFKWTFAEFDGASALLPWAVDQVVEAYEGIAKLAERPPSVLKPSTSVYSEIFLSSADSLPLNDASVDAVVADPPYYDNVMYAELADYFYVWMRRALRDTWPELAGHLLTDKEREAVANKSLFDDVATHSGRGKRKEGTKTASELADEAYERLLTACFKEAHRVLKDDGVMTVMFTHKRVDAWDTLGAALLQAGFAISSSWPVHTEPEHSLHQAKKNAVSSTILLTCHKRADTQPAYWDDIKREVTSVARQAAKRFASEGITGVDLSIATFGPVLEVLSRNWPVYTGRLDGEGNREVLRPDVALNLAREEVADLKKRNLLGGRQVEFDRPTDWWLLAWSDFKAAEFPSGEALKLSIATHLDLDDILRVYKLAKSSSGNVTLLTPAQRRTAGRLDTDPDSWSTLIDALHALMLTYDEEGFAAARALLQRTGLEDDTTFRALVEAAIRAVPRTKERGEFVHPEAKILEGIRTTLFADIEAPPDPEVEPEQLVVFDKNRV